jgi:beta-galactosidase
LSNCEEVELFLNDHSLGAKPLPDDAAQRVWTFAYEPGTLKAVGKNNDQIVATEELKTAGAPAKIILRADHTKLAPAFDDVTWVTATVTDANGVRVPNAEHLISFKVEGPAALLATDNGANNNLEAFSTPDRKAHQGTCIALLRATAPSGKITLTATAEGLAPATVTLDATPSAGK